MRAILICLLLLVSAAGNAATDLDRYPFANQAQRAQFARITHKLRCTVCQNQSLADSNADLAVDLRQKIYDKIVQGKSDKEIISFFVDRYGEFVLYQPRFNTQTLLLWLLPAVLLLLGFAIVYFVIRSAKRGADEAQLDNGQELGQPVAPLVDVDSVTADGQAKKLLLIIIFTFIPLCSLSLYAYLGGSGQWLHATAEREQIGFYQEVIARLLQPASAQDAIFELQEHLQQYPKSSMGWYLLARVYSSLNENYAAHQALAQAHFLAPDDNSILQDYHANLQQLIASNISIGKPQSSTKLGSKQQQQLQVRVSVAPELKDNVDKQDTLFITVRKVGQRMPLWVLRASAAELPGLFVLDQRNAMANQGPLPTDVQLELKVRVSHSGQAITQDGDLFGIYTIDAGDDMDKPISIILNGRS